MFALTKHLAALPLQFNSNSSVVYISGVSKIIADAFSRLHGPDKLNLLSNLRNIPVACLSQSVSISAISAFPVSEFPEAQPYCN